MKVKSILSILLIALFIFSTTACSKENEGDPVLKHEQPIATMIRAIKAGDTESYLNCYIQGARDKYKLSEVYNSRLTEVLQPKQGSLSSTAIKETVYEAVKLSDGKLKQLENDYRDAYKLRVDISKGYKLTVEFSTLQGKTIISDTRELTVVYTKSGWLVYDDVIESFDFKEPEEDK